VGSFADAEDIVQDTFLKWLSVEREKIQNTKAYLVRAVTNNCIKHLQSSSQRKKEFLENLSNSEINQRLKSFEMPSFDFENEVAEALALVHEKLEPLERAVFILREVFNLEYDDLQDIVDRRKDNCRQLFSRAKKKLKDSTDKLRVDFNKHSETFEHFKKGCSFGYPSELIGELKEKLGKE
jgi:RNA polymerase sigma factor (sigma-70 family)